MSWPTAPLGSVADVQLGKMLSPKAKTGTTAFPYLRNVNVQWGHINLSDLVEMDFDEREQEKFSLKQGDLVVCEGGEPGRCAVVDRDLTGVYFQKALMRVRPRNGSIDTRFLQRFMGFAAQRGTFTRDGNQATIAHFPAVKLNALEVPIPPLAEQRRIADILDKADAIRRKRKEAIALTEELLRSAFLEMFGDPVTNPKGWRRDTIGNLLTLKSGDFLSAKQMDSSGRFAVYGGNGINGRHSEYMFEEPMLTIGRVGVYCGAVHLTEPKSWVTDNALYVAKFSEELTGTYLEHALRIANLNQYASQAAQPLISGGRLAPVELLVPSRPAQVRFASFVSAQRAVRASAGSGGAEAENLFNSLVARSFSGGLSA